MAFSWGKLAGESDGRKTGQERKLNAQTIVIDNRCRFAEPWMIAGSNQSDVLGQKSLRVDGPNSAGRIGPVASGGQLFERILPAASVYTLFGLHSGCSFARPRRLRVISHSFSQISFADWIIHLFPLLISLPSCRVFYLNDVGA